MGFEQILLGSAQRPSQTVIRVPVIVIVGDMIVWNVDVITLNHT